MRLQTVCLFTFVAGLPVTVFAADMIRTYERPAEREHVRYERPARTAHVDRRRNLECGDLIVEYRYIPRSEIVTVCHPPIF
jgi:hypothetical protein